MDVNSFDSPTQAFTSEDGVPNVRGRILGGSSAINAGFYSRADEDFYRKTSVNWDFRMVNESYEWVEKAIVFRPELRTWQSAVRDGLLQAGVDPYNGFSFDHVVGTKIGGSTFDTLGRRHSAADLFKYAKPVNVKVVTHANVERILVGSSMPSAVSKQSAMGVVFRDRIGMYHHALLREHGEVILSAVVGITESGAYIEAASNVIPFASPARSVFIRTPSAPLYLTVATLMEKTVGPASAGSLRLASTDVKVNPIVRFNYFSNPVDVQRCVNGTRMIGDILRTRSMEDFKFQGWFGSKDFRFVGPALPVDQSNYEEMADFCRRTVSTIWHYHGGCIMGKVVDADFRVIGIDALRVVDGSTFGISPGTNPQATLMMLGRYVGLKMMKDRKDYKMID
ncbi:hypothetical protein GBA52_010839 [Prunus armeniaca]|nr:hypothetical protein GBA52_010839 [Prunus armeniaca]